MAALPKTAEQEELVIDTIEGLVDFLAYAQDAYEDFKESAVVCPSEEVCAPYLKEAQEAYQALQTLVERHCKVLDLGGFLSQDDVEDIQALYNKIISAKDDLESQFAEPQPEEITESGESESEGETTGADGDAEIPEYESAFDDEDDAVDSHPVLVTQAQGSLKIVDETEQSRTEVVIKQTSIDTETFRKNLKEAKGKAEMLLVQSTSMLREYQAMSEAAQDDEDFKNGRYLYEQLMASVAHLRDTSEALDIRTAVPVAEDAEIFLHQVSGELKEFEKNLIQINNGLALFFEESGPVTPTVVGQQAGSSAREVPKAVNDNHLEAYRPNLFTKNELRPAIEKVAAIPEYKEFLSEYFASPGAFEAYLRREINTREKPSRFDSVFGIIRKSPFDGLLRDMTLTDLEAFDKQPAEKLKHFLLQNDMQYEMYVDWMHAYEFMKELVDTKPSMTFGEVYVIAMVKELMDKEFAHAA